MRTPLHRTRKYWYDEISYTILYNKCAGSYSESYRNYHVLIFHKVGSRRHTTDECHLLSHLTTGKHIFGQYLNRKYSHCIGRFEPLAQRVTHMFRGRESIGSFA